VVVLIVAHLVEVSLIARLAPTLGALAKVDVAGLAVAVHCLASLLSLSLTR